MPETSIVIRTHNEEKHLGNLLKSIKDQDYKDWEVIVVDSGSTDKTLEIAKKYSVIVQNIESRDFTFGYSLNVGCRASKGKYLVFASAHVLPTGQQWLSNLVQPLKENDRVAMVYGKQIGHEISKFSEKIDLGRIFGDKAFDSKGPLSYANNANSAVRRDLWKIKPFDEYLFGLEDIDWARFATKEGYLVRYEPKAAVYHIHTEEWYQVFNRYRREAIAAVRIGLKEPPQAKLGYHWLIIHLLQDVLFSLPNILPSRLEEIFKFRYYQWKGSRHGWNKGSELEFEKEKDELFFPLRNKAVVIYDKNKARFEEIPLPQMMPGDVLLKVDYVGICRTDLEVLEGALGYYKDGLAKHPIIPGHEFSGTIVRVGANNKFRERFKAGQRVVGECILNRGGAHERKEVGVINYNGAYSTYVIMPGDRIHQIPDELDSRVAVMTEPLAVVLRAIRRIKSRLMPGVKILIVGAGPIGNLAAQAFREIGHDVTVLDRNEGRLELLKDLVCTSLIMSGLDKYDVIIEATGSREMLERVIRESKKDSTIMFLGFPYGTVTYNFEDLVGFEKIFAGSVGGDKEDFIKALTLLPKFNMVPFVQNVFSLDQFMKAWDLHRTSQYLKILLKP